MSTITAPRSTAKTSRNRAWKSIAIGAGALMLVLLAALGFMLWHMNYIPANLDTATTRASAQGRFVATIRPAVEPIPINAIHTWTLHVATLGFGVLSTQHLR
jgi:hypothetical protein